MNGRTRFLACLLAAGVLATAGGAIFYAVHGGTMLTRAIAYGFWIAAAVALAGMAITGNRRLARRFGVPFVEGWIFVLASSTLTAVGIVVDLLGS